MESIIQEIAVHYIGNQTEGEDLIVSPELVEVDDYVGMLIGGTLKNKFEKSYEEFAFTHLDSLEFNEVYNYVSDIFNDSDSLYISSVKIAKHLFENSTHPKINAGELYVVELKELEYGTKYVDAVAIFKTEIKRDFIEVKSSKDAFEIIGKKGIDLDKIEKGCIVYNTNSEEGFVARIFDNQGRGNEAGYWREDFLGLKPLANEFHQTNEFLGITKQYISKQLDNEFDLEKSDKIDLLNKSVDYFKTHDEFNRKEFEEHVFEVPELIDSFRGFDDSYRERNEIELEDNFEISSQAVKKQAKAFKSVLKLDKNFHIYIHGDRNLIEKGTDSDGRKFYKVYYDQEI